HHHHHQPFCSEQMLIPTHTRARARITEFASFGQGGDAEIPSPAVPKSDEARAALSAALREHFLFAQLAPNDLAACVDVMGALEVSAGEDIVVQGERGSRFFVMESGSSEV
ncbi:unnamed protein product, partial [Hapterophycus canaliculatus]